MAKKKSVKKASKKVVRAKAPVRKKAVKKQSIKVSRKVLKKDEARVSPRKYKLAIHNLIGTIIGFVLFLVLYFVSTNPFYSDLFYILSVLSGFLAIAYFIVFLIFILLKSFSKK